MPSEAKSVGSRTMVPIGFVVSVVGALFWVATTFATIKYVDDKHAQVGDSLKEIKEDQKEIKAMVLDLYKRKGK